ncbi:DUF7673 family protein [Cupriavidus sp. D39]|uniref:DUF7673 family protein n=1 Tax=Cupriavidus sp. D39 TaxID=2997877 RepID=UPI00226E8967|nr:hypothetical protein [Cupriavidus sp. D39]MCY0853097.1 hypothetical protein [Cupriavidus sp. D39]
MTDPRPARHAITNHVPVHLVQAFHQAVDEFFAQARSSNTAGQRAAEVRAQDHDRGLDSLVHLLELTESDTDQASIVAGFLAGLYNGRDFPFDLTDLRRLDEDLFEHCLAVLRLDNSAKAEVHNYFPDGQARFQRMIADWNLNNLPPPEPAPVEGARYQVKYETHGNAPGYRDVTLYVSFTDDPDRQRPVALCFSAQDGEEIGRAIVGIHRRAWRDTEGPIDKREGEKRPLWIDRDTY